MYKLSDRTIKIAAVVLALQVVIPAFAQQPSAEEVKAWRDLDEDFRQAMVEEISASRGLDASDQNPDWLIRSADDIAEALKVSCDLSGACDEGSERATLGENLRSFPSYDERQGFLNAEILRQRKSGNEN